MPGIVCEPFATVAEFFECDCQCGLDPETDQALVEAALLAASESLCMLSGFTVRGLCTKTVDVCREPCFVCFRLPWEDICGCWVDAIPLESPVTGIISVTTGDGPVPASELRLRDGYRLYRLDSAGNMIAWPRNTTVSYRHGVEPPGITTAATLEFACEIVKRCAPRGEKLPQNAANVSRQGIAISRATTSIQSDATGRTSAAYPLIALFLSIVNPRGATAPSFVWTPDMEECMDIHTTDTITYLTNGGGAPLPPVVHGATASPSAVLRGVTVPIPNAAEMFWPSGWDDPVFANVVNEPDGLANLSAPPITWEDRSIEIPNAGVAGVGHTLFTARRVRVRSNEAFRCSQGPITLEWCYAEITPNPGDHSDGLQCFGDGGDVTVRNSRFEFTTKPDGTDTTACYYASDNWTGIHTFEHCYFAGANHGIRIDANGGDGVHLTDVVFEKGSFGIFPFLIDVPILTWLNVRYHDGEVIPQP